MMHAAHSRIATSNTIGRMLLLSLVVVSGAFLAGCGQDVTMPSTGTVYGDLMYTDGTPAAGLTVMVEGTDMSATSDSKGRFVINDVLAVNREGMGRYYVVRGEGERAGAPVGFIVTHFKVKGSQSYGMGVVVVQKLGSIAGTMLLDGDMDNSGVVVTVKGTSLSAISRADGSFLIDGVPVHSGYVLDCRHPGYGEMNIENYNNGGTPRTIDVAPAMMTNVGIHTLATLP